MKIYDMLGITFDSFNGEAFYNDKMDEVVELLDKAGILTQDRGATIVDLEKYNLNPALIKKSDGATLYITRDLAAAIYRKRNYDFAMSLYAVGNEQSNHFKQLKSRIERVGLRLGRKHAPYPVRPDHARRQKNCRRVKAKSSCLRKS